MSSSLAAQESRDVRAAPILQISGLTSGYSGTIALREVSLTLPRGSVTALLGANGAGKSTLLKTVSGLLRPISGRVELDGKDVTGLAPHKLVNRGLCYIPEGRAIFRNLTVRENIVMQTLSGTEADAVEKVVRAFPILGERLTQLAGTMSGGQQQMLALSRSYVQSPSLILVDEASLGLAPIVVDEIFAFLEEVTRSGASLLLVDQFATRALAMAEQAYILRRGSIVYSGTAAELADGDMFERYLGT